ncbi:MAG TPA: hypothetical protein VFM88_07150 [Vicinamibacteria bacterium]|nr:hypothetical protein [Vicinamibacteria bacterium]
MAEPNDDARAPFRLAKETMPVVVRTESQLIVGELHVMPNKRLKDELNITKDAFIALTDARVYESHGTRLLFAAGVVMVSMARIVCVAPLSGIKEPWDMAWLPAAARPAD